MTMPSVLRPSTKPLGPLLAAALLTGAATPAPAAASGDDVIAACVAGTLGTSYPAEDLRDALANLPTDVAEYTDCGDQIRTALATRTGGGTPYLGASKGSTIAPPAGGAGAAAKAYENAPSAEAEDADEGEDADAAPATTAVQDEPSYSSLDDDAFLAVPVAGSGDGGAANVGSGDGGLPIVPIILALSVVGATAARGLSAWAKRPESLFSGDAA